MTNYAARSTPQGARPVERSRSVHYAVAVRKNVQWVSLIDGQGHGFEPPELPDCVTAAVHALGAAPGSGRWVVGFCREAANILITGAGADAIANDIAARGAREKIVRCAGRDDMQRVAHVLALAGDYVVQGSEEMLIFPPWF